MEGFDLFNTWYGKTGLFGILCFVVWKVYHDMKSDKRAIVAKVEKVEEKHDAYVRGDHERVIQTLQENARSREKLTEAITRMSIATEKLPCNQSQPVGQRWITPTHGTPTPPKGTSP
jgi:hypothetical protein